MEEYINVKISIDNAITMFRERLEFWKLEEDELDLFLDMYESYLDAGVFSGMEFDIKDIVDNDYINYTTIVREDDEDFDEVLELYKEGELTDISC